MAEPAFSRATFCTSGAAILQGPHQLAQKSTRTGTLASLTSSSKAPASTSIGESTGGNSALQLPHLPWVARNLAGTRFWAPHALHLRNMVALLGGLASITMVDAGVKRARTRRTIC